MARLMQRLVSSLWVSVLTLAVGTWPAAKAQEPEINIETTTRVTLSKTAAQPGETALVPVHFIPPKSIPVGRLKLQVTFVSVNAKFEKVEYGPVADPGTVRFHSQTTPGKNESGVETSTVTVVAEATGPSATLPEGLLAYLTLRLSAEARPALITLRAAAEASRPGSDELLTDVRAYDAQLEVQAPGYTPTAVCFFFSH